MLVISLPAIIDEVIIVVLIKIGVLALAVSMIEVVVRSSFKLLFGGFIVVVEEKSVGLGVLVVMIVGVGLVVTVENEVKVFVEKEFVAATVVAVNGEVLVEPGVKVLVVLTFVVIGVGVIAKIEVLADLEVAIAEGVVVLKFMVVALILVVALVVTEVAVNFAPLFKEVVGIILVIGTLLFKIVKGLVE